MRNKGLGIWLMVFLLMAVPSLATAGRMALMPLADLSRGVNSVDLSLTDRLHRELENRGFEMIPQEEVLAFMERHRIRWTGYLDRFHVLELNRELGADLVLLGTVTQWGGMADSVGVALYLIKVEGYQLVWSRVVAYSVQDVKRVLGLGEARDLEDLLPRVFDHLLATLPNGVRRYAGRLPVCDVAGVLVSPRYVRSGEEMTCTVKLRCMGEEPEYVYLRVDGQKDVIPMVPSGRGFVATWKAPKEEGRFPLSLVMEWNHGSGRKREMFLSSFWVDDHPPRFALELKKGLRLGDQVVFRHHIVMVPRFSQPEALSRWAIQILDDKGTKVVDEHGDGNLPRVLVWRGQTSGGTAQDGEYILVLKVWDRAGNMAQDSKKVVLRRTPPRVVMEALKDGSKVKVDVRRVGGEVPLSYWRLVVKDRKGDVLKEVEGEKLPYSLELPANGDKELVYNLEVRDVLGNRARLVNRKVKVVTMKEKKKGGWVESF